MRENITDFLSEAQVDRDGKLVRNVALLGPESRNGYRYTLEAMQEAAPLYDGRPLFVDHADSGPTQRKLRDYAGQVVQPRLENHRIRGDLKLLGPNADWLLQLMEASPRDIGMSHVVLARRNPEGDEVRQIERVLSVDIVAFPATTQSFQEATMGESRGAALEAMLEGTRLPSTGRAQLLSLLERCAEPQELLRLLESYWQTACIESPRSTEKPSPIECGAHSQSHFRNALIAAIRGHGISFAPPVLQPRRAS
jgi:hypothetical protein